MTRLRGIIIVLLLQDKLLFYSCNHDEHLRLWRALKTPLGHFKTLNAQLQRPGKITFMVIKMIYSVVQGESQYFLM